MSLKSTTNVMSHGSFKNKDSKPESLSLAEMSPDTEELCIQRLAEDNMSYFDLLRPYLIESYF